MNFQLCFIFTISRNSALLVPTGLLSRLNILKVEEALKREVTTPILDKSNLTYEVEDALKREISKPKPEIHKMDSMVLNALKRDTEKE